jgi:hypothetical protein
MTNNANKDYSKFKFSELIIELTELWMEWMKLSVNSHDSDISIHLRRENAEKHEFLRDELYVVVEHLDNFFKHE